MPIGLQAAGRIYPGKMWAAAGWLSISLRGPPDRRGRKRMAAPNSFISSPAATTAVSREPYRARPRCSRSAALSEASLLISIFSERTSSRIARAVSSRSRRSRSPIALPHVRSMNMRSHAIAVRMRSSIACQSGIAAVNDATQTGRDRSDVAVGQLPPVRRGPGVPRRCWPRPIAKRRPRRSVAAFFQLGFIR